MSAHPDSRWTHPVCDDCWYQDHHTELHPDDDSNYVFIQTPHRIVEREWQQCCRCGGMTFAGIYVRADPNSDDYRWWCMESDEHKDRVS